MNEDLPFFSVFVRDELAEMARLDVPARAAYWMLRCTLWLEDGVLPADERELARAAGIDLESWPAVWASIRTRFDQVDGVIRHRRVTEELKRARAQKMEKQRGAAITNAKRAAQRSAQRAEGVPLSESQGGTPLSPSPAPSGSPAPAPTPPPTPAGDPEAPQGGQNGSALATPYDVMQWFGLAWREKYNAPFWAPEHNAVKLCRDLLEDSLDKLPPDQRDLAYRDIKPRIARYLASTDTFFVSKKHAFCWFVKSWNALATAETQPRNYVQVPASFPRAKQLP